MLTPDLILDFTEKTVGRLEGSAFLVEVAQEHEVWTARAIRHGHFVNERFSLAASDPADCTDLLKFPEGGTSSAGLITRKADQIVCGD